MSVKLFLNNKWESVDVVRLPPLKEAIDDSLDTATIVFYSSKYKEAIEKNTFVNFNNKLMVVYNDVSENYSKYKDNAQWKHTLSLIETTHLLDLIFCNNICLTNRDDTLYDQLIKMTQNIAFFSNSFITEEIIGVDLTNAVMGLKSAEIYCINQTAKECYNNLLSSINARVELQAKYVSNTIQFTLNYRSGNKRKNLISFKNLSTTYSYDASSMTNSLTFFGQNAVTKYPVIQGYEGFKTTEPTLTSDNACIITMNEIEDVVKFSVLYKINIEMNVKQYKDDTQTGTFYGVERIFYLELDLTDKLIEEEAYNLLTDDDKEKAIPYSKSNIIKIGTMNLWHTFWSGTGSKIEKLVNENGRIEQAMLLKGLMETDTDYPSKGTEYTYEYQIIGQTIEDDITTMSYQLIYYPFLNVYGKQTKNPNKDDTFTLFDNQNEEVLSLEKYSQFLDTKIKRIGNMEIEVDEANEEIKELGDYTEDGYVIYEKEISYDSLETKAHYKLSKDYNMLNSRLAVDQKKRLYEIPLSYNNCYLNDTIFITASFDEPKEESNYSSFVYQGIIKMVGCLIDGQLLDENDKIDTIIDGVERKKILLSLKYATSELRKIELLTYAEIDEETYNNLEEKYRYTYNNKYYIINSPYYYLLSSHTYFMGDSIHLLSTMYDNYSSALSVGGEIIGGNKAVYNPYSNAKGEFNLLAYFLNFDEKSITYKYQDGELNPEYIITCASNYTYAQSLLHPNSLPQNQSSYQLKATNKRHILFNKDRCQRVLLDVALKIKQDNNIFFGRAFFQNNMLLQNSTLNKVYLYTSREEQYQGFISKALGEKTEQDITNLFKVIHAEKNNLNYIILSFQSSFIKGTKSWTIADEEGNVYLAVNSYADSNGNEIIPTTIYFY